MKDHAKRQLEATCPDCRGPLAEIRKGNLTEYKCLVGHRYSPLALLEAHCEAEENSLWAAVVALEEAAVLVDAVAPQLESAVAQRLKRQANEKQGLAAEVRSVLERLQPFQTR